MMGSDSATTVAPGLFPLFWLFCRVRGRRRLHAPEHL
jgi:hypothetical protein